MSFASTISSQDAARPREDFTGPAAGRRVTASSACDSVDLQRVGEALAKLLASAWRLHIRPVSDRLDARSLGARAKKAP